MRVFPSYPPFAPCTHPSKDTDMSDHARPAASRRLSTIAALTLAAGLLSPMSGALAAEGDEVTLYGINDFHGRLSKSGADLACTIEKERAKDGDSLLLSAGDNIGASEFTSFIAQDIPTIDYLNALELPVTAAGNHEFDQGIDDLTGRVSDRADFEHLGANVRDKSTGERLLPAYTIVTTEDGKKVAVIGAVTQSTATLVSPGGIKNVQFTDPIEEVNTAVQELKDSGEQYDMIVASYHEGGGKDAAGDGVQPDPLTKSLEAIMNGTSPEVDAIFTAHTHKSYAFDAPTPGGDGMRPIIQTGSYGANLGAVTLTEQADGSYSVKKGSAHLISTKGAAEGEDCAQFPRFVKANRIIEDAEAFAKVEGEKPVGSIQGDITTAFNAERAEYRDGVWSLKAGQTQEKGDDRSASSALSNLNADALVWATQQDESAGPTADIGVMLPGSVRADLLFAQSARKEGDGVVTFREANDVTPFANNVNTVELTGAQLYTMLEQQWQPEGESRDYLQLGLSKNLEYTFDASAPKGERITSVTLDGKPIDENATYTVAVQSFLAEGGDNFTVFAEGANNTDSGMVDRDAWIGYLRAHKDIAPDFSQRGIGFQVLKGEDGAVPTGSKDDPWTVRVTNLHSTSLGAPQITEAIITIDGQEFRAPYQQDEETGEWFADVSVHAPECSASGNVDALVTAVPDTGTEVAYPVTIEGGDGSGCEAPGEGEQPGDGDQPGEETPAPGDGDQGEDGDGDGGQAPAPGDGDDQGEDGDDQGGQAFAPKPIKPAPKPSARPVADGFQTDVTPKPTVSATESEADTWPSDTDQLPRTGAEIAPYLTVGGVLIAVGVGAVILSRRFFSRD